MRIAPRRWAGVSPPRIPPTAAAQVRRSASAAMPFDSIVDHCSAPKLGNRDVARTRRYLFLMARSCSDDAHWLVRRSLGDSHPCTLQSSPAFAGRPPSPRALAGKKESTAIFKQQRPADSEKVRLEIHCGCHRKFSNDLWQRIPKTHLVIQNAEKPWEMGDVGFDASKDPAPSTPF
jgi:hypothetical protein